MTDTIGEELSRLKSQIDDAKKNAAILEGQLQAYDKQLNEKGFKDVRSAEIRLSEIRKRVEEISKKIDDKFAELKESFVW